MVSKEVEEILPRDVLISLEDFKTLDYTKCAYIFAVTVDKHLKELKEHLLN